MSVTTNIRSLSLHTLSPMSTLHEVKAWLADQLPRLIEKYDVPGAAVAVLSGGEVVDDAAGILSRATGVEATPDSVFQIGSVTKLWTITLVMQLVDEGLVDLDAPIRTYLPDFRIRDEGAAAKITTRQLLCHTAGFEGDIFTDTGPGDDAIEMVTGEESPASPEETTMELSDPGLGAEQPVEAYLDEDRDGQDDRSEQTGETRPDPAAEAPAAPRPKPARKRGRASVPSWDEIMFGGGKGD